MSDKYVNRLKSVASEYEAVRAALAYVNVNWQKQNIYSQVDGKLTPIHFINASGSIESVFVIRLFSTFEGILKEHLSSNHPALRIPEDARAVRLIDQVALRQNPRIRAELREKVHEVRKYRNSLVHTGIASSPRIIFNDALATLAKYSYILPDPF